VGHTDTVDLGGGPDSAEITQPVARPQTECPLAPMQNHLGYVHIRIILIEKINPNAITEFEETIINDR
jgi:hypothetical protein